MSLFDRVKSLGRTVPQVPAGASVPRVNPKAEYFGGNRNPLLISWRPQLRENQDDVLASWQDAAARAVDGFHNSGFLTKILEVETGSVVGAGLRFSSRPNAEALDWSEEYATNWARQFEAALDIYANNPREIDASGRMTFAKMQQAAFASYKAYGEVLALNPIIKRRGSMFASKVMMLPPSRLSQESNPTDNIVQGVKVDEWNCPIAYKLKRRGKIFDWEDIVIQAYDRDGRPNITHIFESSIATTRGISPMANVLKVIRQVDQYADATLTSALIQTIFAATIKTDIKGVAAFDGLMTEHDTAAGAANKFLPFGIDSFAATQKEWYDGAKIDLTQHGRIAHLFPGDELDFTEAKQPGQQYDSFMSWMMREVAAGAGVTYESATGDYRNSSYSSIRMAGAEAWLTVLRRRQNIIVPFCETVKDNFLDEAIYTGLLDFPGGYERFLMMKPHVAKGTWSGPPQPQADDYKAAKAHEVLMGMGATTLSAIESSYGNDWEDNMRQRARENAVAEKLGLPLPWVPKDLMGTKAGQEAEVDAKKNAGAPVEPQDPGMDPNADMAAELEQD